MNLTERGKGAAAFEWRDPDLSARDRDVPYNWKQPKQSFVFDRLWLADIISPSKQTIIAAISSKTHREIILDIVSRHRIEFTSESRKKFHAYEKSASDSNRDGTIDAKLANIFSFIFLLFFFFFFYFFYYYYFSRRRVKKGRKNKKKERGKEKNCATVSPLVARRIHGLSAISS